MNLIFGITQPGTQPIAGDGPDLAERLLMRGLKISLTDLYALYVGELLWLRKAITDEGITEVPANVLMEGWMNVYTNGNTYLHNSLKSAKNAIHEHGGITCKTIRVRVTEVHEGEAL